MRHALVRALVVHYAEAASVALPRVFTNATRFERHMARRGGLSPSERSHLRRGWAIAQGRSRVRCEVYVNVARHAKVAELDDSAAHEVAHLRWPSLRHGALFYRRVRALLDGYHCTPQGRRLPAAFR